MTVIEGPWSGSTTVDFDEGDDRRPVRPQPICDAADFRPNSPMLLGDAEVARLIRLGLTTVEVAHDLGNLLQVVGSAVRMIGRRLGEGESPDLRQLIGGALDSVDRATALSRRILHVSQADRDPDELVQPDIVISEMRDIIVLAAGPSIWIEFVSSGTIPGVLCQRLELENVILNLVMNARDAMNGIGRLTISIRSEDLQQSQPTGGQLTGSDLLLSVIDTGAGMTPEVAAKAFRPFFTTKAPGHGTGVGLATVAVFAQRLGGVAKIESIPGKGTSVTLHLPTLSG